MFILSKKDNTKQKLSNSQLELIKKMDSGLIFTRIHKTLKSRETIYKSQNTEKRLKRCRQNIILEIIIFCIVLILIFYKKQKI